MLSDEQITELLKPIDPNRVAKDGKGFSHVEAWDIRRTMNRIFGFGNWSARVENMELISEREITMKSGKSGWNVVYRAKCVLDVGEFTDGQGCYTEWAAGDSTNPVLAEAHDQAIKTAESQAFKRCAVNLGDQFGLSLYDNGSTHATVQEIVGREHADTAMVSDLLAAFEESKSVSDLEIVSEVIPTLDLSEQDKKRLRAAYKQAHSRVTEQEQ